MTTPKIKLEGVTKSFGDNHVLMGVDLEVFDGESLVLIGGSASCKTLILKCILGLATPDVGDLLPSEISGGMQKRVGFARAIASKPEIVLLDEPTAGLDPIMTNIINELILDGLRDLGATTLSITSDMTGARKVADRIAMIYDGKIIWCGAKTDVDSSGNDYVDQFIHNRGDGPIKMAVRAF